MFLADQLLHVDILDMAAAYKFEVHRYRLANEKETDMNDEEVTVSIMADLQDEQDKESERILAQLQEKVNAKHKSLCVQKALHIPKSDQCVFHLALFPQTNIFSNEKHVFSQALFQTGTILKRLVSCEQGKQHKGEIKSLKGRIFLFSFNCAPGFCFAETRVKQVLVEQHHHFILSGRISNDSGKHDRVREQLTRTCYFS